MKRYLYILLILLPISFVQGQELPIYNQYLLNGFLLNPANAGIKNQTSIAITDRHQWVGVAGAPEAQTISFLAKISKRNGLGAVLYRDQYGDFSLMGGRLGFSHNVTLGPNKKTFLALGATLGVLQNRFNIGNVSFTNENDPILTQIDNGKYRPDADFGIKLYNENFFVGLSATRLLKPNLGLGREPSEHEITQRHFYVNAGYFHKINPEIEIAPSVLLKANENMDYQIDGNLIFKFYDTFSVGASYRTNNTFLALVGLHFNRFTFMYAFNYDQSKIFTTTMGTHEIMLEYILSFKKKRTTCPAFM